MGFFTGRGHNVPRSLSARDEFDGVVLEDTANQRRKEAKSYKTWDYPQDIQLVELFCTGLDAEGVGDGLGRSRSSITGRLSTLGLTAGKIKRLGWRGSDSIGAESILHFYSKVYSALNTVNLSPEEVPYQKSRLTATSSPSPTSCTLSFDEGDAPLTKLEMVEALQVFLDTLGIDTVMVLKEAADNE